MPVLDVEKDLDQQTMTVTAEFAADVARVWALYADPRRLERHWGPPGWPATFVRHELVPGARSHYFMTGPDGERAHGMWIVREVDEPRSFTVDDAFADDSGEPDPAMGFTRMHAEFEPAGERTRVRFVSTFESVEQLQKMLDMGMEEGLKQAMGQIDALLAEQQPATA
ncbi:SRPBCC domain-containing protein [Amnibacterium sp. CER49]|uniref:SRPBCC family protein n=1 Tax=Amnibacterium sp. CER49 TaxID=3039161 RepID=UPI00244955E8|nr:SRPBCC domain-containing protein [Amnibacterium sp. CER49]MDH2445002.1 SRPBCC domain-containing protein [Amnibacterium sp. CER49]